MTDVRHGDEGRRQAYLAALGIPLWSARVELPGALPSAPLDFVPFVAEAVPGLPGGRAGEAPSSTGDAATPAVAMTGSASASGAVPAAGAGRDISVTAGAGAGSADGAPPRSAIDAPRAVVATAAPAGGAADRAPARLAQDERFPRINCRAWTLAPGLGAVIALDDAPDLAAAEYRLLDNIARALDAPDMPSPQGNLLRWPLNRNPALDHGPEAMRTWLAHALRLPPGRCVVFGETLAGHVAAALPGTVVIPAPTLAELLADAAAKRRLWQALHG